LELEFLGVFIVRFHEIPHHQNCLMCHLKHFTSKFLSS